jgi:hypothetical protein
VVLLVSGSGGAAQMVGGNFEFAVTSFLKPGVLSLTIE